MQSGVIAETERLVLRRFREADVDGLGGILGDPDVMKFSLNGPYSLEQTGKLLKGTICSYGDNNFGLWAVVNKSEDCLIGCCGYLKQNVDGQRDVELAYRLAKAYWGMGLATEAAKTACQYAFEQLKLNRLISIIEAENIASIRVAEKCGMTYEKDSVFHGIEARIYVVDNVNQPTMIVE